MNIAKFYIGAKRWPTLNSIKTVPWNPDWKDPSIFNKTLYGSKDPFFIETGIRPNFLKNHSFCAGFEHNANKTISLNRTTHVQPLKGAIDEHITDPMFANVMARVKDTYGIDPLKHNKNRSCVALMPTVFDDHAITNIARVSTGTKSNTFVTKAAAKAAGSKQSDEGLLQYLVRHDHWTPLAHFLFVFNRCMPHRDKAMWVEHTQRSGIYRHTYYSGAGHSRFLEIGSLHAYAQCGGLKSKDIRAALEQRFPYAVKAYETVFRGTKPFVGEHGDVKDLTNDVLTGGLKDDVFSFLNVRELAEFLPMTMFIEMPGAICRQWFKHVQGIVRNEESGRYVVLPPSFYVPALVREQAASIKQGSKTTPIEGLVNAAGSMVAHGVNAHHLYTRLLDMGVAKEIARFYLTQASYFRFIETTTVGRFAHMHRLRAHLESADGKVSSGAQWEAAQYAGAQAAIIEDSPYGDVYRRIME